MAGRGAFNSRIGFLMAAIGSAVGLGNLWRFPYLVSQNGGAIFVGLYIIFLFVVGIPALLAELSIGRARQKNVVDAFEIDRKGRNYSWVGFLFIGSAVILLSYYSVIAGWAIAYAFTGIWEPIRQMLPGFLTGDAAEAGNWFIDLAVSPWSIFWHLVFMALTTTIVIRGVSKGIEKSSLIMMPILFAFIVALAIYGGFQNGAGAGYTFYFKPDWSQYQSFASLRPILNEAAGQTFFSIGLGLGTMLTYSSYLSRENNLQQTGLIIGISDTLVAIIAGLMVFPLMFSLGLQDLIATDSSVGGLFIILPTTFGTIGGLFGLLLAVTFFVMLGFAALSSAISLLEVPVSYVVDRYPQWGRPRAALLVALCIYLLGIPAAISLEWLDFADAFIGNIMLLLGGLLLNLYVGWIRPDLLDELKIGLGKGRDFSRIYKPIIRYPLPILLTILLGFGVVSFFENYLLA